MKQQDVENKQPENEEFLSDMLNSVVIGKPIDPKKENENNFFGLQVHRAVEQKLIEGNKIENDKSEEIKRKLKTAHYNAYVGMGDDSDRENEGDKDSRYNFKATVEEDREAKLKGLEAELAFLRQQLNSIKTVSDDQIKKLEDALHLHKSMFEVYLDDRTTTNGFGKAVNRRLEAITNYNNEIKNSTGIEKLQAESNLKIRQKFNEYFMIDELAKKAETLKDLVAKETIQLAEAKESLKERKDLEVKIGKLNVEIEQEKERLAQPKIETSPSKKDDYQSNKPDSEGLDGYTSNNKPGFVDRSINKTGYSYSK
jgi:hypothetical protein